MSNTSMLCVYIFGSLTEEEEYVLYQLLCVCMRVCVCVCAGERPYHCTDCEKKFTQLNALQRHQRIHTGEKPYMCTLCNRTFTDKSTLRRHAMVRGNSLYHHSLWGNSYYLLFTPKDNSCHLALI